MSTISPSLPEQSHVNFYQIKKGVMSWVWTLDHKRIGLMYLGGVTFFFLFAVAMGFLLRLELFTSNAPGEEGILGSSDFYNRVLTIHGVSMVFLFIIPGIPGAFGNFFLPIMIGADDVAFPRLNLLSWYFYVAGAIFALCTIGFGGVDTGWTFYAPYSVKTSVVLPLTAVFVIGWSSILTGINFVVTIHRLRAKGMNWFDMPLFCWALYATSWIQVVATPVIGITLILLLMEKYLGIGIFDPAKGGDPVLFQHMFWFYSHPAVYIMILPGFAVISDVIACYSRKRIFGYSFVAFSSLAIAVLGFLVWGHHMFVSGQSTYASMVFSFITFFVAVPSAVKIFNWSFTLHRGSIKLDSPMLYAMGFIGLFTIGGLTGLFLSTLGVDVHLHDTYFVVAHFHYVMVGGMVMAFLGGLHFWWPKMTGRMYPEGPAKLGVMFVFAGFNLTFLPQFVLGYMGMPRRYHAYPEEWQALNIMSTAGATVLGLGFGLVIAYFIWSLFKGEKAPANPFQAKGLEWDIPSPPIAHNFEAIPIVTWEAYPYGPEEAASQSAETATEPAKEDEVV